MISNFLRVFVIVFVVFIAAGHSYAQDCSIQKEAIVKLRKPSVGAYNVWDTIYGAVESDEGFKSVVVMESGNVMVAGELSADAQNHTELVLAEIGRNGRVMWEKKHKIAGLESVVKLLNRGDGVLVLASVQPAKARQHTWIGFFNLRGDLLSEKKIKGGRADFIPQDIVFYPERDSYVLSIKSQNPDSVDPSNARLYRLNSKGQVISGNEFVIGADNEMSGLHVLENGDIMGVGGIGDAKGRMNGWVVRLNKNLRIIWQQAYPRGAGAALKSGAKLKKNLFVTGGTALPAGEGNRAGWVMVIDALSGNILWQRYFSGALHFDGRSVMANDDGMISFLMDGDEPEGLEKIDEKDGEHVRILTLNPRGLMFGSDEFFHGAGVDAFQMIEGVGGIRLVSGKSRINHVIEAVKTDEDDKMPEESQTKPSMEGWLIAAPAAEPYEDPCVPVKRTLDD